MQDTQKGYMVDAAPKVQALVEKAQEGNEEAKGIFGLMIGCFYPGEEVIVKGSSFIVEHLGRKFITLRLVAKASVLQMTPAQLRRKGSGELEQDIVNFVAIINQLQKKTSELLRKNEALEGQVSPLLAQLKATDTLLEELRETLRSLPAEWQTTIENTRLKVEEARLKERI